MSNQKIKILHGVSSLNLGGAERLAIDVCHLQNKEGTPSSIYSLGTENDALVSEAKKLNISVTHAIGNSRWYKYTQFIKLVKSNNITVLHFHSPALMKFLLPVFWLLPKETKIIYTRHGAAPYATKSWRLIHQLIKPFVKHITFVSNDARDVFHKNHNWPLSSSTVIKNGIIVPPKSKLIKTPDNVLRLGSIGRMDPIKGQKYLLQALAEMAKEQQCKFELHFFGHGSEFENLSKYALQHLGAMKIVFHGIVKDRSKIYSQIDIQVVCSKMEGLSLAIMEAMANSIPTVATNVGGNPELINHKSTGMLFEYADTKTLSSTLIELYNNRNLLSSIEENAYNYIAIDYSLSVTLDKYNKIYSTNS
ncbi:MAG: glycosyltransferase family 4 protein [Paraglaciecola sp.]|nr:glycosyltransferase family 4 protein [Paraglaciecola sp.]